MQKTAYNNHYYLLLLICLVMLFLPANKYASVDAVQKPEIKKHTMPAWCSWIMIVQIAIVYFYATLAKFYPGWLDGTFAQLILEPRISRFIHDADVRQAFYLFISYAGIAFDMLVVPLLLLRKTRTIALLASLAFHLFNSLSLHIGIFPFFALSFVVFFYPPEKMRRIFFPRKPVAVSEGEITYEGFNVLKYFFVPYLIIQLLLPLRHYFIMGDVLWTEEGHRLSWRMMLRQRYGSTHFKVVDKETNMIYNYNPLTVLTLKQNNTMQTRPDMIWQMAQYIKQEYAAKGINAAVYADSFTAINKSPHRRLIDPSVDLAQAEWDYFFHCEWILLYDDN